MSPLFRLPALALAGLPVLAFLTEVVGATPPPIRLSVSNQVPACVTPERMMSFIGSVNPRLDPRYKDIARWYQTHGETWRVRWDYAMYQMIIETNFLSYRRGDGRPGDVAPRQNNFAGIGATGGGEPGDRFPDIKTGVLAQMQHLVVYSGERVAEPAAPRTQLKQDDILEASVRLDRAVTFSDLARRWAADKHYGRSIEIIAARYRSAFCAKAQPASENRRALLPPPSRLGGPMPDDFKFISPPPSPRLVAANRRPLTRLAQAGAADTQPVVVAAPKSPVRTIWSRSPRLELPDHKAASVAPAASAPVPPTKAIESTALTAQPAPVPADDPPVTSTVVRPAGIPPPPEATIPQPVIEAAPIVLDASVIEESQQPQAGAEAQTEAPAALPQFMPVAMVLSLEETWAPPMALGLTTNGKLVGRLRDDNGGAPVETGAAAIQPQP